MPRLKKATDANGNIFYPVTITKGIWDTENNQRLSVTLSQKISRTETFGPSGANKSIGLVPAPPS
jgi:hypothetical protein